MKAEPDDEGAQPKRELGAADEGSGVGGGVGGGVEVEEVAVKSEVDIKEE